MDILMQWLVCRQLPNMYWNVYTTSAIHFETCVAILKAMSEQFYFFGFPGTIFGIFTLFDYYILLSIAYPINMIYIFVCFVIKVNFKLLLHCNTSCHISSCHWRMPECKCHITDSETKKTQRKCNSCSWLVLEGHRSKIYNKTSLLHERGIKEHRHDLWKIYATAVQVIFLLYHIWFHLSGLEGGKSKKPVSYWVIMGHVNASTKAI